MEMDNYRFSDLRVQYLTGQVYTISGEGRNRKTGYRHGVRCTLGNIEKSQWMQLADNLIASCGETELHANLIKYMKENHFVFTSQADLAFQALELHIARIFDDPLWVSFIPFNCQYRPEYLQHHELIWILPECCKQPGQTTKARFMADQRNDKITVCPHCGRWSFAKQICDPEIKNDKELTIREGSNQEKTS